MATIMKRNGNGEGLMTIEEAVKVIIRNKEEFMKRIPLSVKEEMTQTIMENKPETCLYCFFFKAEKKDGKYRAKCLLMDGKDISDVSVFAREKECPLDGGIADV